jgi:3-phosphoshikimate 1-carboxyvinyltransferase
MQQIIYPSFVNGTVKAPASKSVMQRACAAALIRKGVTHIYNAGISNDDKAALAIIQTLGATVQHHQNYIAIYSKGLPTDKVVNKIHCNESGLSIRMFTPLVALFNNTIEITGAGSLQTRPMHFFDEVLPQLKVEVTSNNGKLPIKVKGPLQVNNITVDGSLSSQYITGLLMAYAAVYSNQHLPSYTISVNYLNSKPYVDVTLAVLQAFGLPTPINNNYKHFTFMPMAKAPFSLPINYNVEGDWSGAAFLLVAAATAGNVKVEGLQINSQQADKKIMDALAMCGAIIITGKDMVQVSKPTQALKPFHFNAVDCPDLFPPLVALAANCNGISVIEGISRLTFKESNRAITLQQEFKKLNTTIELVDDCMKVHGNANNIMGGIVHSHNDHRIAMALAVAALNAKTPVTIENADAINKSYPLFYQHLQNITTPQIA